VVTPPTLCPAESRDTGTVPSLMVIVPREFGQVMSDAMNGLANVWKTLLVPALAVFVPVSVITVLVFAASGAADFLDTILNRPESLQALPDDVFWELARPFVVSVSIAVLLQVVGGVFVALATHTAVAAQVRGEPMSGSMASRLALNRYLRGLGATLLVILGLSILIGLGSYVWLVPALSVGTPTFAAELVALLLLAVLLGPGVWAAVSASMTTSAVALEDSGALASVRRSMRLVKGRWWATAGFLLVVGFLGGVATQLIQLVALPLVAVGDAGMGLSIASALGVLAQGLLMAAIAAMFTHWYIDLRARKESLTIESLG
jgi:hypothetical protein